MKLKESQIKTAFKRLHGWRRRGKRISKLFVFDDFLGGMRFLNRVARVAERMNHHPDVSIHYNKFGFSLTTHDEGGLTRKDFKLAEKIDRLRA